jgi:hypothetical protein
MALTYTWKLTGLKKQTTAVFDDLVIGTRWKVTGTDEDGFEGSFDGATPLDIPDADEAGYIPYEELTEELVLGWIKQTVSGSNPATNYWDHINGRILKAIDGKKNVTTEIQETDLPWSPTSGSATPSPDAPASEPAPTDI